MSVQIKQACWQLRVDVSKLAYLACEAGQIKQARCVHEKLWVAERWFCTLYDFPTLDSLVNLHALASFIIRYRVS